MCFKKVIITLLLLLGFTLSYAQTPTSTLQTYQFVFLSRNAQAPNYAQNVKDSLMKGHFSNMERLAKAEKLLVAGPFYDGGGIFIFGTSGAETQALTATDPAINGQLFNVEIVPFQCLAGGICPVGKEYTMTSYGIVRFEPTQALKAQEKLVASWTKLQDDGMPEMVATLYFPESGGGLYIFALPQEAPLQTPDAMPAFMKRYESKLNRLNGVANGAIKVSIRNLYVAKGSFCED